MCWPRRKTTCASTIRRRGASGTTSGPISFWRVLSEATNAIQQGAFRRGANMGMMKIDHPDILKFIFAKQDLSRFQNYNISVKVTDKWMAAYKQDASQPNLVTNYRTGKSYEIPIENGTVRAAALRDINTGPDDFGLMAYDPAFTNTAHCQSKITMIDGDRGILDYRGYARSEGRPFEAGLYRDESRVRVVGRRGECRARSSW